MPRVIWEGSRVLQDSGPQLTLEDLSWSVSSGGLCRAAAPITFVTSEAVECYWGSFLDIESAVYPLDDFIFKTGHFEPELPKQQLRLCAVRVTCSAPGGSPGCQLCSPQGPPYLLSPCGPTTLGAQPYYRLFRVGPSCHSDTGVLAINGGL